MIKAIVVFVLVIIGFSLFLLGYIVGAESNAMSITFAFASACVWMAIIWIIGEVK